MTNTWDKTYYGDRYYKGLWYDQFGSWVTINYQTGESNCHFVSSSYYLNKIKEKYMENKLYFKG